MAYPSGAIPPILELPDRSKVPADFVHLDMHVGNDTCLVGKRRGLENMLTKVGTIILDDFRSRELEHCTSPVLKMIHFGL